MNEMTNPAIENLCSRRDFLTRTGGGLGMLALSSILGSEGLLAKQSKSTTNTHHPAKAKSVVWLFMNGGPSGIDLFDHKPALEKWDGKFFPGKVETLFPHPGPIMRSPFEFKRYGESSVTVSNVYSHIAQHVDDITFLNACSSTEQNHTPACYMMNTGAPKVGAPCVGSWVTYGLGTENANIPGYVLMYDPRSAPEGGANLWDSAFLPGENQAVPLRPRGAPILYLNRPQDISHARQKSQLELLRQFNAKHMKHHDGLVELDARIRSFETAYRMQTAVPDLLDLSKETEATRKLYGLDEPECKPFGSQLLMARRMVESGVRFIQIYQGGSTHNWDQHSNLERGHTSRCNETGRAISGFLTDLKQRGLFDSTLVIWGGEFGRTPTSQDRYGRDHNPFGFQMWLAGGGVRRGFRYGQTDEFGYKPVENAVSMHDLHATILHLTGLDHEQLTYYFNGREQSLTNGLGSVVHDIIA